jgi:hypothetical protein
MTGAFLEDNPMCTQGPCRRFQDTIRQELGTSNGVSTALVLDWGAESGWYIDLACIPLSIVLLIVTLFAKFPIPIDSVAAGESL